MTTGSDAPGSVLFVQVTAQLYGADRALLSLATGLVERGWRVGVLVPDSGPLAARLEAVGVEVHVGSVAAFRRHFNARQWARFALIELPWSVFVSWRLARRYDVVHVNTSVTVGGGFGARLARRQVVWHLRESIADHARLWRLYGLGLRVLSDRVVVNSRAIEREARGVGLGPRVRLVHDGVELSSTPLPGPDRYGIVTVGRINAGKGHAVLVDAVAILRERGMTAEVDIIGDAFPGAAFHFDDLNARIAELGLSDRIRVRGFVEDVEPVLDAHAIFAFPSVRPEGFGLALVEAMARGMAVVATAHGGPLDIIDDDRNGLLVPPRDASALADAIGRLLADSDLRARLGRAAVADAATRFGADRVVDEVEAVYRELLTPRSGGGPGSG